MAVEDPIDLLGRLRLGREEYCQRLLTMLILGGAYPRWNTRNRPSPRGAAFLADLYAAAYPGQEPAEVEVFVDEFDLPPRTDAEKGGAPDWAVLWPDRLWMIELKTERASHRDDQLPHYRDLARHHHSGSVIDLTYLTPRMASPTLELRDNESFAHLAWEDVAPLIQSRWADGSPPEQAVASVLLEVLDTQQSWVEWREARLTTPAVPTEVAPGEALDRLGLALALAAETAADGQQRGLDCPVPGVEDLHLLRLQVRDALRALPAGDPVRVVRPWVWSATSSGGTPLTGAGAATGYELRVSRYTTDPG